MLIQGGRVVDPVNSLDACLDVRLRGDRIVEIGEHLRADADEDVLDASGAYVAPGFIDMHAHLREPGNPEKETLQTGLSAAVAGGFTGVAAMPNTNPAIDSPELVRSMLRQGGRVGLAHLYSIAAITRGRGGTHALDYSELAAAGASAFSDDGNTVMDGAVMFEAARRNAESVRLALIVHCEDEHMKRGTVMTLGPTSRALGLPGVPPASEDVIVARDILIAAQTGSPLHIAHLSTRGALEIVRWAKNVYANTSSAPLSCEVAPHHLVFTESSLAELGAHAKVNPPLRFEQDVRALRDGVRDGTIDVFATDHAPHTVEEKSGDLRQACVGFSGLEIAIGAYAYAIPDLPVRRFVELLSVNPARILRVEGGSLSAGARADVTIFADRPWRVDPQRFRSKGKATPFAGMELPRMPVATIVDGRVVYQQGEIYA